MFTLYIYTEEQKNNFQEVNTQHLTIVRQSKPEKEEIDNSFTLTISPYEVTKQKPDLHEIRIVTKTGIDIEKYDNTDPFRFAEEVKQIVSEGKDFDPERTIGTVAGMTVAEAYYYHLDRIAHKKEKGQPPNFWDLRLACTCVMQLRAGFSTIEVTSSSQFSSAGLVVDALPDGSQVRLLFELPSLGFDNYKNQMHLVRFSAQWFELPDGDCTTPEAPFKIALGGTKIRGFLPAGIKT